MTEINEQKTEIKQEANISPELKNICKSLYNLTNLIKENSQSKSDTFYDVYGNFNYPPIDQYELANTARLLARKIERIGPQSLQGDCT